MGRSRSWFAACPSEWVDVWECGIKRSRLHSWHWVHYRGAGQGCRSPRACSRFAAQLLACGACSVCSIPLQLPRVYESSGSLPLQHPPLVDLRCSAVHANSYPGHAGWLPSLWSRGWMHALLYVLGVFKRVASNMNADLFIAQQWVMAGAVGREGWQGYLFRCTLLFLFCRNSRHSLASCV